MRALIQFGPWFIEPLDLIEILATLLALVIAVYAAPASKKFARRSRVLFQRTSTVRGIIIVLAVTPVALRLLLATLPGFHLPRPFIPDEFSYILAGDTFAHFRLTNPQHPLWQFFDSFHVLSHPTYASKYPPGQGLVLAAGKLLFGSFRAGVHLSIALLTASMYWMLRGWAPRRWAVLGALIVIVRFGLFSYWMDSFWGGAVAAIGGTLVLGAYPRILRSPNPRDAVLAGLGFVILAISRPFEGALYCVPFAIALTFWLLRSRDPLNWTRFAVPFCIVLGAGIAWLGYYQYRVTGSPFTFPHALYAKQYQVQPYFRWQKPFPEPVYSRPELRNYWAVAETRLPRQEEADPRVLLYDFHKRIAEFFTFYFPFLQFAIFLVAMRRLWRRQLVVLWAAMGLTFGVSVFGTYDFFVHYMAPLTGICVLFVVEGLRWLESLRFKNRPSGMVFAWSAPAVLLFMVLMRIIAYPAHLLILPDPFSWNHSGLDNGVVIPVEQTLRKQPGQNLVFVRYTGRERQHANWIHNGADIDHSQTIWARDKGPLNEQLIRYYPDRTVWLLDQDPVQLTKVTAGTAVSGPAP